jgi:hypothetical protein
MSPARKVLHAFALLSALLVSGCGGIVQTYEGPKKSSHEIAILKTNVGELTFDTAWVDQVDDKTLVRAYTELEVAPGRHSLRVQLSSGIIKANTSISFEAKAGRTYRVKGIIRRNGPIAWIEDDRTGEVIAGEKS